GNLTGVNLLSTELTAKRLELLREMLPRASRIAVLVNPTNTVNTQTTLREVEAAGRAIGFARFAGSPNGGLIVTTSALSFLHRDLIIALAARHKLPAIYYRRYFATVGGLISYGYDVLQQFRGAADYVDRILRGKKPAELPVQAPTKYE